MSAPRIERLAAPRASELASMTFPAYRHLLTLEPQQRHPELGDGPRVQPIAWSAELDGEAVGLALAEVPVAAEGISVEPPPATEDPHLLSVFVRPQARRRGVASALVAAVEAEVAAAGFPRLSAVYTSGKPAIDWMERLFRRRGWEEPRLGSLSVRFDPRAALQSPAFEPRRMRLYGRGLEIFPWRELDDGEYREIVRSNEERCWIEPSLAPWVHPRDGFDGSSVGARCQGRVVAWVLNHRMLPGVVRFSTSFMRRDLSCRGKILPLFHASLQRVVEPGPGAEAARACTFITPISYPRMIAFIRKWIVPFADFVGESRQVAIDLDATRLDASRGLA